MHKPSYFKGFHYDILNKVVLGATYLGRRKNTYQTHNQRHQKFTWKIQIGKNHGAAV